MNIYDRYVLKHFAVASVLVSAVLIVIIMLTQSLRFLELVIDSGASTVSFWMLTFLALPRFFEIILPIALTAGALFTYNRLATDSELAVFRSSGFSPLTLARPALIFSMVVMVLLWSVTLWVAPKSLSQMQQLRQIVKTQFSALFLKEGVFNQVGDGLMVYVRGRLGNSELEGIVIHDARDSSVSPATILAKRGTVVEDEGGYKVVVYDGSRQVVEQKNENLQRLDFERYVLELPDSSGPARQRWKEPDERTIGELLAPNLSNERDRKNLDLFRIELHRRITSPFLAIGFTLIACSVMLLGSVSRRGYGMRALFAVVCVIVMEGVFLASANIARSSALGLVLMYLVTLGPVLLSLVFLSPLAERLRSLIFLRHSEQGEA